MSKNSRNRRNYLRLTLQWGILTLLAYMSVRPFFDRQYFADFEAYCPFGGMQALGSFFQRNTLTCSMTTVQIALGLALLLGVILLSKLFCSFVCPIGTLTEWLGMQARKLKMQVTIKGPADKALRLIKYALLFITFYYSITNSELFCKKFDPYYAAFTGFSGDVVWYFALPALIFTIIGSFFIRQFWCKYLCPLSAVTNLAVYALPVAALSLLWVMLNSFLNLDISWVWLLGAACITGFILEATTLKFLIFPPLRITRDKDICTSCRICDKKCPMALEISTVDKVNHIDCHLCTDCIVKCPEKGALSINKRPIQWLPAVATVILIAASILIANRYELPTISERWVDSEKISNASVFELSGLKNIKCFGSSRAFANQMKDVPGVLGVETYVKHFKVVVYYDKSLTNPEALKKAIFSPVALFMNPPASAIEHISFVTLGIDHCFDPNDQYLLADLMTLHKGILAMETSYGEPVKATFYYDSTLTQPGKIEAWIGQKSVIFGEGEDQVEKELDFVVNKAGLKTGNVSKEVFLATYFDANDVSFNKFDTYKTEELKVYRLIFNEAIDPALQQWMPFLISHLSNDDGIVRFKTLFTATDPLLEITYVPSLTTPEKINKLINAPKFLVHYPDKSVKEVENPFKLGDNRIIE
ncbi:MAG: 4Fe-4S binding protein [Bacteroidales bacterium]|nr:4Fe-4S binding protein [Bacteroidales bacterium]